MTKKWIFINMALLIAAVFLGWQLLLAVRGFNRQNDPAKLQVPAPAKPNVNPKIVGAQASTQPQSNQGDFQSIVSQNLFSDTRSNVVIDATPVVEEAPPLRTKPILLGVMINGSESSATVLDPTDVSGGIFPGKRRGRKMHIGDDYQGYALAEISKDKIVLKNGSRSEEVMLGDTAKQKILAQKTKFVSKVVNFGSSSTASATMVAAVAANQRANAPGSSSQNASPNGVIAFTGGEAAAVPNTATRQTPNSPATVVTPTVSGRVDTRTNAIIISTPNGPIMTYPP